MSNSIRLLSATLLAAVLGCDEGPPPGPGTLTVTLTSPTGAEGAARIRLVGKGLGAPVPIAGEVHARQRGDTMEVMVMLEEAGVLHFGVEVSDTTQKPRAEVVQVAGPDNRLRAALEGYDVEVRR